MKATHQDTMLVRFLIDIGGKRSCDFHFWVNDLELSSDFSILLHKDHMSDWLKVLLIAFSGDIRFLPDTAIAAINWTFWNHWEKLDQGGNVMKKP